MAWLAPLVVALGALAWLGNPGRHPGAAVALLMLAALGWALAVARLENGLDMTSLLGVAVLLRLVLLGLPPELSDDTLRYVWDGRVAASGANPYVLAPEDPRLEPLRDERWLRMPHKHVPTVYPPLALGVFTVAGLLPAPLLGLKIILVLADLVGCWLLAGLARRLGLPLGRAAWYAWNPLVVLEIAGQGHVDGLMVPAMILAVSWLVAPARPRGAGVAAAAGVLAKLVPLVALPVWARTLVGRRGPGPGAGRGAGIRSAALFLAAAGLVTAAALAPVAWSVGGVPPGLVTYGVQWEWNGPLYEPLWRLVDLVDPVDEIKSGLDRLKELSGRHDFWNRFYPFVYPQMLAKLLLAAGFGVFWLRELRLFSRRPPHPVAASGRIFGAVLLAAATVYPWYLLWVLPWAALGRRRSWLVASGLAPLSYLPQHADVPLFPWMWALMWLPFFVLAWREPPWPFEETGDDLVSGDDPGADTAADNPGEDAA